MNGRNLELTKHYSAAVLNLYPAYGRRAGVHSWNVSNDEM